MTLVSPFLRVLHPTRLHLSSVALLLIVANASLVLGADSPEAKAKAGKAARGAKAAAAAPAVGDWVEKDFPFFSSVLDARKAGTGLPANNLSPRGIILNLGSDCWACFDPDLLRVSAVWRGMGVAPTALAPGSYLDVSRKTPGGQVGLPTPEGQLWISAGIYPGWQAGDQVSLDDPREPAPSPEEIGRGPIPESMGRFEAIRLVRGGVVLEYVAAGTKVREWTTVTEQNGQPVI